MNPDLILVVLFSIFVASLVNYYLECKVEKDECPPHQWSKNVLTNEIECMRCNARSGEYSYDNEDDE